jgi:hypothetical protein
MSEKDEIAALKKEVEALKSALSGKEDKPQPKKEFVPQPYQRYDPTAGMSMPRSALEAMIAAEPRGFMAGVVHDNRNAPTSPTGMIPRSGGGDARQPASSSTPGWVAPTPLSNPPGVAQADRLMDAADRADRIELAQRLARQRLAEGKG